VKSYLWLIVGLFLCGASACGTELTDLEDAMRDQAAPPANDMASTD